MSRIGPAFAASKAEQRAALVGYLTAFDPNREASLERIVAACEAGLDVLELGVPFSDPNADGPDIQAAMVRALGGGATLGGVLEMAREIRSRVETPIIIFSYANPLFARGAETFAKEASDAGVDGVLVVDVPPEHAPVLRDAVAGAGLDWIGLVAPTTRPDRMAAIADVTTGFVYTVTLRGVTGAALDATAPDLEAQLTAVRERFNVPVAAGFGIRTPEQAAALANHADGVVVGSALVRAAQEGTDSLTTLVRNLRASV